MTISVTQLTNYIKGVFDIDGVLSDVTVLGEVTNVRPSRDCVYFSLKDDGGQIDCFTYSDNVFETARSLEAGRQITASGRINFLQKSAKVSFYVSKFFVSDNLGAAYLKFVELKGRLEKEGLFDAETKKKVPASCRKIGVVTSKDGAVIHDIVKVVLRRQPFTDIILYPVRVQGVGAEQDIALAIEHFSFSDVDVVILARGGGSNEDLSVFNAETVVRALAKCQKPTVSAIGHGIDFTLSDFAADKRAVTPSEAAEFVTLNFEEYKLHVDKLLSDGYRRLSSRISNYAGRIKRTAYTVSIAAAVRTEKYAGQTSLLLRRSFLAVDNKAASRFGRLETLTARINAANPAAALTRGFAAVSKDDKRVTSVKQLSKDQKVTVALSDGSFDAVVIGTEEK